MPDHQVACIIRTLNTYVEWSVRQQEFSIDIFIFRVYRAPTVAESYPASVDVLH